MRVILDCCDRWSTARDDQSGFAGADARRLAFLVTAATEAGAGAVAV